MTSAAATTVKDLVKRVAIMGLSSLLFCLIYMIFVDSGGYHRLMEYNQLIIEITDKH
jgi:hypothetical protein